MNAKNLFVAMTVLVATGAAFAGNVNPFPAQEQAVPNKTRAQVHAELVQANKQGWVVGGQEFTYPNDVQAQKSQTPTTAVNSSGNADKTVQMEDMMKQCHEMMMKS